MANLFRNLFGHKKSHSREQEDNGNEPIMERNSSRRASSRAASRATRVVQDDSMLPPTAAYHTQTTRKLPRGPKSCPGELSEESSRTYVVDAPRRRSNNNIPSSSSMMMSSTSSRPHYQETSEYGSENTSPIGHHRLHYQHHQQQRRRHHHQQQQDVGRGGEEEEDEEDETEEEVDEYQEIKRKIRAHYEQRLMTFEKTQRVDHRMIKTLEKEKDDLVRMLIHSGKQLEKERERSELYKRKWQRAQQQLNMAQQQGAGGQGGHTGGFGGGPFGGFQTTPQFQPIFQFGSNPGGSQRYSFMGAPMHPISSSNTPTTSAMDTTAGGAGESLVSASDVSYMAPMTLPPLDLPVAPTSSVAAMNLNLNLPSTSAAASFFHDDDEDQDETKNFREFDDVELPRGSANTLVNEIDTEQFLNSTRLEEDPRGFNGKDSGFSTTPDDVKKAAAEMSLEIKTI